MFLVLFFVHFSCVDDELIPFKKGEPRLVLNAVLSPEQDIALHLSKSFENGSKLSEAILKEPAIVRVYINNQFRGNMIPDDPEPVEEEYARERLKGRYCLAGVKPLSGDEIRLEAEAEGLPTATATIRIPDTPVLLSVDTIRYTNAKNREMMRLYVKMEDRKEQRNYYRMLLSKKKCENGVEKEELFPSIYGYYTDGYYEDPSMYKPFWEVDYEDPVFTADLPTESIGSAERNEQGIFTDNLFNGSGYVLKLSFSNITDSFKSDTIDMQITYYTKLLAISESYYLYYKRSSGLYLSIGHIQLAPARADYMTYSNVENGFGLVASYNETKYAIDMPYVND